MSFLSEEGGGRGFPPPLAGVSRRYANRTSVAKKADEICSACGCIIEKSA